MTRRGAGIVSIWLLTLTLLAALVARAHYSADMSVFLPRSPTPEQALLVDQLREGTLSRLILVGIAGGNAPGPSALSRAVAARLRDEPAIASVLNGDDEQLAADRQWLFDHRYVLSPAVDGEHFSRDGLHAALKDTLDWLASPAGMLIEPLVPRDPTGELIRLLESFDIGSGPRREEGVWFSRDRDEALLLVLIRGSGVDIDAQADAMARIQAAFDSAVAALPDAGEARLEMTGPGVFAVASRATIKGEVKRIALLASLLIAALLLLIFRSPTLLVLGLLPVATGALAGIAAVSLGFGVVHGLTIGFGATLIGEAVDYAIYLFVQRGAEDGANGPAMSAFWPTIRLGLLTSVCGFGVMLGSGFPGLAQLGLYSTTGLIAAALVTRKVLPVLLPAGAGHRDFSRLGGWLAEASRRLARLRWLVPVLCLVAIAVIWQQRQGLWNDSLLALSPIPPEAQALDARLRAALGAPDTGLVIVVDAPAREDALRQAELLAGPLERLTQQGAIAGWDSPARYLPSTATQNARLASLPGQEALSARLADATAELPLKAERLAPFLDDVAAARAAGPVTAESLAGTSLALALETMLRQTPTGWRALLPLKAATGSGDSARLDDERVHRALAGVPTPPGVSLHLLDLKHESDALYADYLEEAIALALLGLVAIVCVLTVALRSARRLWRVMLPLIAAVLVVVAGLTLAGERLILLHLVGLLLVVAVGSNYALFFVRAGDDDQAPSPRILASLLFANLTTLAGFGLLATSSIPVLHAIGVTVGPGAVLALLFAATLSAGSSAAKWPGSAVRPARVENGPSRTRR